MVEDPKTAANAAKIDPASDAVKAPPAKAETTPGDTKKEADQPAVLSFEQIESGRKAAVDWFAAEPTQKALETLGKTSPDAKAVLTAYNAELKTMAGKPVRSIQEFMKDPATKNLPGIGNITPETAKQAADFYKDAPKEAQQVVSKEASKDDPKEQTVGQQLLGFFGDNKGGIMGMILGALAGAAFSNPLVALLLALVAFVIAGSLMDGPNGIINKRMGTGVDPGATGKYALVHDNVPVQTPGVEFPLAVSEGKDHYYVMGEISSNKENFIVNRVAAVKDYTVDPKSITPDKWIEPNGGFLALKLEKNGKDSWVDLKDYQLKDLKDQASALAAQGVLHDPKDQQTNDAGGSKDQGNKVTSTGTGQEDPKDRKRIEAVHKMIKDGVYDNMQLSGTNNTPLGKPKTTQQGRTTA